MSGIIIALDVPGLPETKGSWIPLGGGAMKRDNPREKAWSHTVGWAARGALRARPPSPARVRVDIVFRLPAPVGNKNKRDLDKLLRSSLDALSKLVYVDDEQVDMVVAEKIVTPDNHGATISVSEHVPRSCATLGPDDIATVCRALSRMVSDCEGAMDVTNEQALLDRLRGER